LFSYYCGESLGTLAKTVAQLDKGFLN